RLRRAAGAGAHRILDACAPRARADADPAGHAQSPARGERRHPQPVEPFRPRLGRPGWSLMAAAFRSLATALPEHRLEAADALHALRQYWPRLDRLEEAEAGLGTRYTCEPLDQLVRHRSLTDLREAYLHHGRRLAERAARDALARAGFRGS